MYSNDPFVLRPSEYVTVFRANALSPRCVTVRGSIIPLQLSITSLSSSDLFAKSPIPNAKSPIPVTVYPVPSIVYLLFIVIFILSKLLSDIPATDIPSIYILLLSFI